MTTPEHDMSIRFYNYLCDVVGTEKDVKTRRLLFTAFDNVMSFKGIAWISSGSKAEGLDLKGSDFDIMGVQTMFPVYERDSGVFWNEGIPIIMETNKTKPGFTRLIMRVDWYNQLGEMCEMVDNVPYVSSKFMRGYYISEGSVIHGPCTTDEDGVLDFANTLHCKEWITIAQPWIDRSRSSWPTTELIESIIDHGILFVPIGCKNSPHEHLEWRISFSVAEKLLIYSFTQTQLFCYALLKILLKDIISKKHPELLCSYFLKTIMFWISEECCPSLWIPENLLRCFMNCFQRLIYCVEHKTCLHYFIPEYNLFEDRFSSKDHVNLLSTLRFLYALNWECVLRTNTLKSFCHIQNSISPYIQRNELNPVSIVQIVPLIHIYLTERTVIRTETPLKVVHCIENCPAIDIFSYFLSLISPQHGQNIMSSYVAKNNKNDYHSFKKCLSHLLIGLYGDSVSCWLLVASLFYSRQQYQFCLHIIRYTLEKCIPHRILISLVESSKDAFERQFPHWKCKNRVNVFKLYRKISVGSVDFTGFSIIPLELLPYLKELTEDGFSIISIPVLVFSYFLRFLCYHRLNKKRDKLVALDDLIVTVRERHLVPSNPANMEASMECLRIALQMSGYEKGRIKAMLRKLWCQGLNL